MKSDHKDLILTIEKHVITIEILIYMSEYIKTICFESYHQIWKPKRTDSDSFMTSFETRKPRTIFWTYGMINTNSRHKTPMIKTT